MTLRPYQMDCVNNVIEWIKKSVEPAVVEATVSFGKTRTISHIAKTIVEMSGKKVLILCPTGILASQNAKAVGEKVSIFSSSLKSKSLRHDIVVGTPQTIKNHLSRFGSQFGAILIDEGEGLTNAVIAIVNRIREMNKLVRVIGFTGTPFRTGTGYVYALDLEGNPVPDTQTIDPFYSRLIHRTGTKDLMAMAYLTPMVIGEINATKYETGKLKLNKSGRFNPKDIAQCYVGRGRETSGIVQDIVAQSHDRGQVMVFAASIDHVKEIMESMPDGYAVAIHGEKDNEADLKAFREGRVKCAVNVDMLTVGADFPRVDVIALLRKTESARLLQQILGRGIRLHPDVKGGCHDEIANSPKPDCLLLDYTQDNAETHYPDGDLWNPVVKAKVKGEGFDLECTCPSCGGKNTFAGRKNDEGYEYDSEGYFTDLAGDRIESEYGPIPAHHGRRCLNMVLVRGSYERCEYRWTSKECHECGEHNDIAARRCVKCKAELVNPNEKLVSEFRALKRDPTQRQTDKVVDWTYTKGLSQRGAVQYRINWQTEFRSFTQWVAAEPSSQFQQMEHDKLMAATDRMTRVPDTITYKKDKDSGFYRVHSFNQPADERPEEYAVP